MPRDFLKAFVSLMVKQEKGKSKMIRGALLQAWPDWFASKLGAKRYSELLREYYDKDGEE